MSRKHKGQPLQSHRSHRSLPYDSNQEASSMVAVTGPAPWPGSLTPWSDRTLGGKSIGGRSNHVQKWWTVKLGTPVCQTGAFNLAAMAHKTLSPKSDPAQYLQPYQSLVTNKSLTAQSDKHELGTVLLNLFIIGILGFLFVCFVIFFFFFFFWLLFILFCLSSALLLIFFFLNEPMCVNGDLEKVTEGKNEMHEQFSSVPRLIGLSGRHKGWFSKDNEF